MTQQVCELESQALLTETLRKCLASRAQPLAQRRSPLSDLSRLASLAVRKQMPRRAGE